MWVFYIPVPKGAGKALARKLIKTKRKCSS